MEVILEQLLQTLVLLHGQEQTEVAEEVAQALVLVHLFKQVRVQLRITVPLAVQLMQVRVVEELAKQDKAMLVEMEFLHFHLGGQPLVTA